MKVSLKRPCPRCHSDEVFRSHRRGAMEKYVLRLVGMRPYRCVNCDARFYGLSSVTEQPTPPHLKAA